MKTRVLLLLVLTGVAVGGEEFTPLTEQEQVWVLGLEAPSLETRRKTRASLTRVGSLPFLLRVLESDGAGLRLRTEATYVIHELGPQAATAVTLLVRGLEHSDDGLRTASFQALGAIGPTAESAVPALLQMLRDPDSSFRYLALRSLAKIGVSFPEEFAAIGALVTDPDRAVRMEALGFFIEKVKVGARLPLLRTALSDPDDAIAARACEELLRVRDPLVPILLARVGSDHPGTRRRAVDLASFLSPDQALPIVTLGIEDRDPAVRILALSIARSLGPAGYELTADLGRIVTEEEGEARLEAIAAIGGIGRASDPVVRVLVEMSHSSDAELALTAVRALCPFPARHPRAEDRLRQVVEEDQGESARAALPGVADAETFLTALRSAHARTRLLALELLRERRCFDHPGMVDGLCRVYREGGRKERNSTLQTLGYLDQLPEAALELIIRATRSPDSKLRRLAIMPLGRQAKRSVRARVRLAEMVKAGTPDDRRLAFDVYWNREIHSPEVMEMILIEAFDDPVLCRAARSAFRYQNVRDEFTGVLEDLVATGKGWAAIHAARALEIPLADAPGIMPGLIDALRSGDPESQGYAVDELGGLWMPTGLAGPALAALTRPEVPWQLRWDACRPASRAAGQSQAALPDLVRVLRDEPGDRDWILATLRAHGPNAGFLAPDIVPFLRDADPGIRRLAADALLAFEAWESVSKEDRAAAKRLAGTRGGVRIYPELDTALTHFEETGDPNPALEVIRRWMGLEQRFWKDYPARYWVSYSPWIVRLGPAAAEFLPGLFMCLPKSLDRDLLTFCDAIVSIGPAAVPPSAELLDHPNPTLRFVGVRLIGKFGPLAADHRERLRELSGDDMLEFRAEAAWALAAVAPAEGATITTLIALLRDPAFEVRAIAAAALWRIGPPARLALPALRKSRTDAHPFVRELALRALGMVETD